MPPSGRAGVERRSTAGDRARRSRTLMVRSAATPAHAAVALVSLGWFAQGGWKKTMLTDEDRQVVRVAEETITEEGIR